MEKLNELYRYLHGSPILVGNLPVVVFLTLVFTQYVQFRIKNGAPSGLKALGYVDGVRWTPGVHDTFKAFMYSFFPPLLVFYETWLFTKEIRTAAVAAILFVAVMVFGTFAVFGAKRLSKPKLRITPKIKVRIKKNKKRTDPFEIVE